MVEVTDSGGVHAKRTAFGGFGGDGGVEELSEAEPSLLTCTGGGRNGQGQKPPLRHVEHEVP